MERHQAIFVLQDNKISQWILRNGELKLCTKKGLNKIVYDSSMYWKEWKEDNYFTPEEDVFDVLFLADDPNVLKSLPTQWVDNSKKTHWTIEQLSLLAQDDFFSSRPLTVMQGCIERGYNQKFKNTAPVKLFLRPSLGFSLPEMYMLLCKEHLYIVSPHLKRDEIKINSIIRYQPSQLQEKIKQIKDDFLDGFNLADQKELSFVLIENEDKLLTQKTVSALGNSLKRTISLDAVIKPYFDRLNADSSIYVDQFGINFDGINYSQHNGSLTRSDFSLTGFTVKDEEFMDFCIQCVSL